MVHKKYIKRGDKVFGPYYYENYREKGAVKTRYYTAEEFEKKFNKNADGKIKKDKSSTSLIRVFLIIALILIVVLFLSGFIFVQTDSGQGGLFSEKVELKDLFSKRGLFDLQIFKEILNVVVEVSGNYPPKIWNLENEIYVCENKQLFYYFNASDENIDNINVLISPPNPFFINFEEKINSTFANYKIISGVLQQDKIDVKRADNQGWAVYKESVIASDGYTTDLVKTNITIIEVNDKPIIQPVGVHTIWTHGDDSIFYYELNVSDEEDGNRTDGNLVFNLYFLDFSSFFDIDENGIMNVDGNDSSIAPGVYNLRVCANDSGLNRIPHFKIDSCLPENVNSLGACDDFSLTITNENRAPEIKSFYPNNGEVINAGYNDIKFNVSVYDADGTLPDVYWYVNGEFAEKDSGNLSYDFIHNFGCGVSGDFNVSAIATDGLLNDSIQWNISVAYTACPGGGSGGGGGGGGILTCNEEWVCEDWHQCRNLKNDFDEGSISKEFEIEINARCDIFNYNDEVCGYHERECIDLKHCKSIKKKPGLIEECYYTENPTCGDGIRNCHEGSCEILIDCGGPCFDCPTCNDGLKNQDEEGVDCGGQCSLCIEKPYPGAFRTIFSFSLIFLLIIVLILLAWQIRRYFILLGKRKKSREDKKKFENMRNYSFVLFFFILFLIIGGFLFSSLGDDKIIINVGEGYLGTRSLMNNFLRSFAEVFSINIMEAVIGTNADMVVWDDTDIGGVRYTYGGLYGKTESDWRVYFYVNFTDKSGNSLSPFENGDCRIEFYDDVSDSMSFNPTSKLWEYSRSFQDKGVLDYDIECASDLETLDILTNVEIQNTPPLIQLNLPVLLFDEDLNSSYDFNNRVFEDDKNDILSYSIKNISGVEPSFFYWIKMDNSHINISATKDVETGTYGLGVEVVDLDGESVSRIQTIEINPVNDAPRFINLEDKSFSEGDLFEYVIKTNDEENNFPFTFEINSISCDNEIQRGNCSLLEGLRYKTTNSEINISFVSNAADIGNYIINFSVMDNNSLGNKMTSKIVEFSVNFPIWKSSVVSEYFLNENDNLYINLTDMVKEEYQSEVSFSYENEFGNFDIVNGIVDFGLEDIDVGFHRVKIIADNGVSSSPKFFEFDIKNIDDGVLIVEPLSADGVFGIDADSNIQVLENARAKIYLFAEDDDFFIKQKTYYDEDLNVSLVIEGNSDLFEFEFDSMILDNRAEFAADFIPRDDDVGDYVVKINVSDKTGNSDYLDFNLEIINRDYDVPVIQSPAFDYNFELVENISSALVFMANHSVGDELEYRFYFDDVLKYESLGAGNGFDFVWNFAPNFSDETYGKIKNLTLVVFNPYFNELNDSRTWNLSIQHSNSPVEFYKDIGDKVLPYDYVLEIDLKEHLSDSDAFDDNYNQKVEFEINSNASDSFVDSEISDDWILKLLSSKYEEYSEMLNITARDLNLTNSIDFLTEAFSNNFLIEFVTPEPVVVHVPTSGGGGGGGSSNKIISLKLITPREISVYEGEKIEIPLSLVNKGTVSFNDINLTNFAYKDGNAANLIETSLDKEFIKTLEAGKEENLTLLVSFENLENRIGDYEIFVNLSSKSPKYFDWAKININLQRINETSVREMLVFTEELIAQSPQCIEISEIMDTAQEFFERGDFLNAQRTTEQALSACKNAISQVSLPRKSNRYLNISLYLILISVLAFALGIIYYFWKRKGFEHSNLKSDMDIVNKGSKNI